MNFPGDSSASSATGGANGDEDSAAHQREDYGSASASSAAANGNRRRKRPAADTSEGATEASASAIVSNNGDRNKRRRQEHDYQDEQIVSTFAEEMLSRTYMNFLPENQARIPTRIKNALAWLDEPERDRQFHKVLRLLIVQGIFGNKIIKKDDLKKALTSTLLISPMLDRANWYLRKKFGMEIVPLVETLTSETAARETLLEDRYREAYQLVIANRQDPRYPSPVSFEERRATAREFPPYESARMSLVLTVLSIILLQHQQCATAETIEVGLRELDSSFDKKVHPVFGEWENLVFRRFYDELLLDRGTYDHEYWYFVGPLARSEIGVSHVYDFANRIVEDYPRNTKLEDTDHVMKHRKIKSERMQCTAL